MYQSIDHSNSKSICVVGAGAAGICVARRILEQFGSSARIRVFEQFTELGGTWIFTDENSSETHSSMYEGLRSNIPKEVMQFDDFPFEKCDFSDPTDFITGESFPSHYDVLAYLQRFAQPIKHMIRFNSPVISIKKCSVGDKSSIYWEVIAENKETKEKLTESFDSVFICSGHYFLPRLPNFVEKMTEIQWTHSHTYRHARDYAGKRVAIVGARTSGLDLVQQLIECAKMVYLVHKKDATNPNILWPEGQGPPNVVQCARAIDAQSGGLILADGRILSKSDVDHVIFCTGYRFSMPFLEYSDQPIVRCLNDGSFVSPLFAHVAHVDHLDSLFFIGLTLIVAPFQIFEHQIRFALALLTRRLDKSELSRKEVVEFEQNRIKELGAIGRPLKFFHELGSEQWAYCDWLESMSKSTRKRAKVIEKIYQFTHEMRLRDQLGYRKVRFRILDKENFEVIPFERKNR